AAMTAELAYVSAVEKVAKFEVPRRAQYLRVIAAELQRIASHCLWLGTWCMDMGGALGGGATVFLYCIREREMVLDRFEELTGARLLYGFHQVGGIRYDVPAGWDKKVRETLDVIEARLDEYEAMLDANAFFRVRTQGVGVISRELAQAVGARSAATASATAARSPIASSGGAPPSRTSRCCRTSSPATRWRTSSRSWAPSTRCSARSTDDDCSATGRTGVSEPARPAGR